MAAKKTGKKAAAKTARKAAKKTASKKATKKAARSRQAASKKTTKKAAGKTAKKAAVKAAAVKTPPAAGKATSAKPGTQKAAAAESPKKSPRAAVVSSVDVNLGHVFALRPRVQTSFKPDAFRAARVDLRDEPFESLEQAARAVAEKALEITHQGPLGGGTRRRPQ